MVRVAVVTPAVVDSVPVPRFVPPSVNVTVPVGPVAPLGPVTRAVNVSGWPKAIEPLDGDTVVVGAALFTTWLSAVGVLLALKFVLPPYAAVIGCVATASVDVVSVAVVTPPVVDNVPVPINVLPSVKLTVPVGAVPVPGVTVAVSVTDAPNVDGLSELFSVVVVVAWLTVTDAGVADADVA